MNHNLGKENITVVCVADNNYAMPVAVTACSILKHLPPEQSLDLYILDAGIEPINVKKILKSLDLSRCKVNFINTKDQFKDVPTSDHLTESTFHRLLIPQLLSQDLHKVIYLDCDLLVLSDLSILWNIDIGDKHILAVQDLSIKTIANAIKDYQLLGIPPDCKYFNAGVLVFNLDKWREFDTSSKTIEYVRKPRKSLLLYNDQDALNAILWDKWLELEPKWNRQFKSDANEDRKLVDLLTERYGEDASLEIANNPYIIHFIQDTKPWQYYRHPKKNLFYEYLDLTDWAGWRYSIWTVLWRKLSKIFSKYFVIRVKT
jgi:lipopolysaccharide biosynthesis glycosyltransferase